MSDGTSKQSSPGLPRQHNLQQAVDCALGPLAAQPADQLAWLGARAEGEGGWRLNVLDGELIAHVPSGQIRTAAGKVPGCEKLFQRLILEKLFQFVRDSTTDDPPLSSGNFDFL